MVVQVGSLDRHNLEPFKTWYLETPAREDYDVAIDFQTDQLSMRATHRCPSNVGDCASRMISKTVTENVDDYLRQSMEHLATPTSIHFVTDAGQRSSSSLCASARFTLKREHEPKSFEFMQPPSFARLEKRQRAGSDVDGPFTAGLSCKKRRLRLQLVTSRLSQPYSLPATHIFNRDAIASGDRRFAKLAAAATSTDSCKQNLNRDSSLMLRAAVLNRARLRVQNDAIRRRGDELFIAVATTRAALLHDGQQLAAGTRFVAPSPALAERRQQQPPPPRVMLMRPGISNVPNPIALPLQAAKNLCSARPTPSPNITPQSPQLHPTRSPVLVPPDATLEEMEDDDTLAFPTSAHDCPYAWADEDDLEDVYSDFGVIFGVSNTEMKNSEENEHSYEECLDELDGISWIGR